MNISNKPVNCKSCMYDAPYYHCCKIECGEHYFCKDCKSSCRKDLIRDCD